MGTRLLIAVLVPLVLSGCHFGSSRLDDSHLAYNQTVEKTLSEEVLLNIVRLRYFDATQFLFVDSIAAQFSLEFGTGDVTLGTDGGSDIATVAPFIKYTDQPTITFLPRTDKDFIDQLTSPLDSSIFVSLASIQPRISLLFRLAVISLNGQLNTHSITSPGFQRALESFDQLEQEHRIAMGFVEMSRNLSDPTPASRIAGSDLLDAYKAGLRFEQGPIANTLQLVGDVAEPSLFILSANAETDMLVETLQLEGGRSRYPVRTGEADDEAMQEITIRTRSVIGILQFLSHGVDVPESHVRQGIIDQDTLRDHNPDLGGLFRVRVSATEPTVPCIAVRHRDHWFYVPDTDRQSKRTFALLREIFHFQLAGSEPGRGPLLTLPLD